MTHKEYKEILNYELYRFFHGKLSILQKIRIKYFQPNTNCILLSRKMWYYYQKGGVYRFISKLLYLKISRRYGCIIFPTAQISRGFHITHPTGIVIGNCKVGENFMVFQNCCIRGKKPGDDWPSIGNNVQLCSGSIIIGNIKIDDNVIIGAMSLVIKDINEPGTYAGNPLKKIK